MHIRLDVSKLDGSRWKISQTNFSRESLLAAVKYQSRKRPRDLGEFARILGGIYQANSPRRRYISSIAVFRVRKSRISGGWGDPGEENQDFWRLEDQGEENQDFWRLGRSAYGNQDIWRLGRSGWDNKDFWRFGRSGYGKQRFLKVGETQVRKIKIFGGWGNPGRENQDFYWGLRRSVQEK